MFPSLGNPEELTFQWQPSPDSLTSLRFKFPINTLYFVLKKLLVFIYFWERKESEQGKGQREREGDTESEAGPRLQAVSTGPDAGLKLTNREIMT